MAGRLGKVAPSLARNARDGAAAAAAAASGAF